PATTRVLTVSRTASSAFRSRASTPVGTHSFGRTRRLIITMAATTPRRQVRLAQRQPLQAVDQAFVESFEPNDLVLPAFHQLTRHRLVDSKPASEWKACCAPGTNMNTR